MAKAKKDPTAATPPTGTSPAPATDEKSSTYVKDFISGTAVRATPEEVEAVQVFARRLVEDFGYPKAMIQTRPQHKVRPSPSASKSGGKAYPIDIAVFNDARKLDDDLFIVVECKRPNRQDGRKQLELYLTMSPARVGVWFNGNEHLYLVKRVSTKGVTFEEIPTIPRCGQEVADIGSLTRGELTAPGNLKAVFKDIRNHLAANAPGTTKDELLAPEIMAILFCKIFDEFDKAPDVLPDFRARVDESPENVSKRIKKLFESVRKQYPDVFDVSDKIQLDPVSIKYVVGELQTYEITTASRDAIGEAFEVFIGPATRGDEGQFFTPRNVVHLVVSLLDPKPQELLIDPACGSGGFLVVALQHMWSYLEKDAKAKKWSGSVLEKQKEKVATNSIRGVDKDSFLTKVTKAYMALIGDGRGGIFCQDSLAEFDTWQPAARAKVEAGTFDIVLTNPPFGSKQKVKGAAKLKQYDLARKWKSPTPLKKKKSSSKNDPPAEPVQLTLDGAPTAKPKTLPTQAQLNAAAAAAKAKSLAVASADWVMTEEHQKQHPTQVLFIERCLQLLKPGGRMGIILPESIFGMPSYGYIVKYLMEKCTIHAFVSLPEEVFQPWTHAKTCVLIATKNPPPPDYEIHMAIADWCGHDSRGNPTIRLDEKGQEVLLDDLPKITEQLKKQLEWEPLT